MVKLSLLTIILTSAAFANGFVVRRAGQGNSAAVFNDTSFCSFLPRKPGGNIGESESNAIPFCTTEGLTPGAKAFPDQFIKSVHFNSTKNFVQITGTINPSAYKLSSSDGGGQFDTHAPQGAACQGFTNFVNLVEPDIKRFCIRCCHNPGDCKVGESTKGCAAIIPGDYS